MSGPAMEDELHEMTSMRLFVNLSLNNSIPDHTTIMNFRQLLEKTQTLTTVFKSSEYMLI